VQVLPLWTDGDGLVRPCEELSYGSHRAQSFGGTVHTLPDLDGDGLGELMIGLFVGRFTSGSSEWIEPYPRSLVHCSVRGTLDLSLEAAWAAALVAEPAGGRLVLVTTTIDERIAAVDVKTGAEIWSEDYDYGWLEAEGATLAVVGDYDQDGLLDFAHTANETGADCDSGFLVIHSAADGSHLSDVPAFGLDHALQPYWKEVGCAAGYDVTAVADHDGDGFPELALHAPGFQQLRLLDGKTLTPLWNVAAPLAKP
jgi:hypothetical protein